MKPADQIKAIAELDGWVTPAIDCTTNPKHDWTNKNDGCCYANCPPYLTSRDAIVPVIEKKKQLPNFGVRFTGIIDKIVQPVYLVDCVCATPAQLCEALLRATGKWD